jgi:hypothetical protein
VHSLFADSDDWDGQLEGTESGWPGFFRTLQLYLTHFRGLPCSTIRLMAAASESESKAWERLVGSLGLVGAAAGQRRNAPAGVPPFAGVVEYVSEVPRDMLLRLEQPAPGVAALGAFACGGPVMVAVTLYLYGERAAAAAAQHDAAWQKWMSEKFPPVAQPAVP